MKIPARPRALPLEAPGSFLASCSSRWLHFVPWFAVEIGDSVPHVSQLTVDQVP